MFPLIKKAAVIGLMFFALVAFWPALKKGHSGPARVIDADTIEIGGERHRLYGLDAVEFDQICRTREGTAWPCGRAVHALGKFLEGRKVVCEPRGQRDAYGRHVSICYAGSDSINAWVAREGWAVADHDAGRTLNYTSEESTARFLRKGIWSRQLATQAPMVASPEERGVRLQSCPGRSEGGAPERKRAVRFP
ncbi:MAG: thermonuclease family protein [Methyloceanibacter sp.]